MPVSGAAGRSVSSTRAPVCRPTPVVRVTLRNVRCISMLSSGAPAALASGETFGRRFKGLSRILARLPAWAPAAVPGAHAARPPALAPSRHGQRVGLVRRLALAVDPHCAARSGAPRPLLASLLAPLIRLLAQECRDLRGIERAEASAGYTRLARARHRRLVELVVVDLAVARS